MREIKKTILLFFIGFLSGYAVLPAWGGEALVNSEVEVDVTGKDAADARATAMAKGQTDALSDLLNKLATPEQAESIMNSLDPKRISDMVRGMEVLDEKISDNRYRAHLIVTFDGNEISNMIGKIGADSGQDGSSVGSFLVIPAYEEDGTVMLWEDANPWRTIWKNVGLEVHTGDVVVAFGDNSDISIVDAKNITSATYASLVPLTIRYGVSDIVILHAKYARTPDMTLTVVKRRLNRTQNEVNMLTYRADPQETKDMLLARAARDIVDGIHHKKVEELATVKTVQGGERNSVMMLASISTMASWTQLRSKLSALPMIDRLDLIAIAPQQVDMVVHYRGSPESLAEGINAQGIRLVQNPTYWVISRD